MMATMMDPGAGFVRDLDVEQLEALVETMYLVAFADGEYGEAERCHFERSIDALTAGRMSGASFDHVIARMVSQIRSVGRDGCIASLRERLGSRELRQVALVLAVDMAGADGVLHPNERSFIQALAGSFGMDDRATREVLEGPPRP